MVEQATLWPWYRREKTESKLTRDQGQYLHDRVQFKINQYVGKAVRYRYIYLALASFAAVGSAVVPVLINIPGVDALYPTILGLGVAAIVALEKVWHPAEHWRNYDLISAVLREEEMRFSTGTPPYGKPADGKEDKSFTLFVERVEAAIAKERSETVVMRTTSQDGGGNS